MSYVAGWIPLLLLLSLSVCLTSGTNIIWQGAAALFFAELLPCCNDPTPHILWLRSSLFPNRLKKCRWSNYEGGSGGKSLSRAFHRTARRTSGLEALPARLPLKTRPVPGATAHLTAAPSKPRPRPPQRNESPDVAESRRSFRKTNEESIRPLRV